LQLSSAQRSLNFGALYARVHLAKGHVARSA
jgi:hypothetical protein